MQPPVFLLLFSQSEDLDILPSLKEESVSVYNSLVRFSEITPIMNINSQTKISDFESFISTERMEGLVLFHFSGHTGKDAIFVENGAINPLSIATYFSVYSKNLKIVFLNGCGNIEQVNAFLDAGAKVVIATQSPVDDSKASTFSIAFYNALQKKNTLEDAFKLGIAKLNETVGNNLKTKIIYRGSLITDEQDTNWTMVVSENDKSIIKTKNWWKIGVIDLEFLAIFKGGKKDILNSLFIVIFTILGFLFLASFFLNENKMENYGIAVLGVSTLFIAAFFFYNQKKYKTGEINSDYATGKAINNIQLFKKQI